MIPVPPGVRVWLATGHTDMRNYAERTIMWSPILTDPDFSLLSTG
jgi:hypothetical protein